MTDLHQKAGNIGLADGGAQQVTISGLQTALQNATNGANLGVSSELNGQNGAVNFSMNAAGASIFRPHSACVSPRHG